MIDRKKLFEELNEIITKTFRNLFEREEELTQNDICCIMLSILTLHSAKALLLTGLSQENPSEVTKILYSEFCKSVNLQLKEYLKEWKKDGTLAEMLEKRKNENC